MLTMEYTVRYT